jgi:hypothetical protein
MSVQCRIVGGGIAAVAVCWLSRAYDVPLVYVSSLVFSGMAAWSFTPEHRALSEDAFDAMGDIDLKQDAAAALVARTPSQLSAQKVGRERLNLADLLAKLGPAYRVAFGKRMLRREGIVVPDDGMRDLAREISADLRTELRALLLAHKDNGQEDVA